ncbi:hypothetical protein Cni_G22580 [Canna indica]|uniref:Uncharacterized protein n=1 Tax=Canna indica TaxID=4628 RepID=A0AAQ3QMS5_9LILI|nr:hypothetical protein Cni_G22580 [Canna indica]
MCGLTSLHELEALFSYNFEGGKWKKSRDRAVCLEETFEEGESCKSLPVYVGIVFMPTAPMLGWSSGQSAQYEYEMVKMSLSNMMACLHQQLMETETTTRKINIKPKPKPILMGKPSAVKIKIHNRECAAAGDSVDGLQLEISGPTAGVQATSRTVKPASV